MNPTIDPIGTAPEPDTAAIEGVIQGYGYDENLGIARRRQRALELVLAGHYTPQEPTLTSEGCPIVLRFRVRSGTSDGHYHVTRLPNAKTDEYSCTCPDSWNPCKHRYGAALIQAGLRLAYTYRLDIPAYAATLRTMQHAHPFGSHEIAALQVLLNLTATFHPFTTEATRQHYGTKTTYASRAFTAMVDGARRHYGAGYVGVAVDDVGELHRVAAGQHTLSLRWHSNEVRWYVVGDDGQEDVDTTESLVYAPVPIWTLPRDTEEPSVDEWFEEEPDGHYSLVG